MAIGRSLAVSYGRDASPAYGGVAQHSTIPAGQSPAGAGMEWVGDPEDKHCLGVNKLGEKCGAYKAKNSDLCAGHLRQQEVPEAGE